MSTSKAINPKITKTPISAELSSQAVSNFNCMVTDEQLAMIRATAAISNAFVLTDSRKPDNPIVYANPAFYELTGYCAAEIIGFNCRFLQGPLTDRVDVAKVREAIRAARPIQVTLLNYRKDGSTFWNELTVSPVRDETGEVSHFVAVQTDVSLHKHTEAALVVALQEAEERADKDPLTGLLNHRAFQKQLEQEASRSQRDGKSLVLMLIDIDNFKFFNDVYGHIEGDSVLLKTANALKEICRPYDTIARFSGDEFALILPDADNDTSNIVSSRIRTILNNLNILPPGSSNTLPLSVSIGSATLNSLSAGIGQVVELAEQRLNRTKTGGEVDTEADEVRKSAANESSGFSMLDSLVTAVDNKDRYTRNHSEDVMKYALMIARELGLDDSTIKTVSVAALLHDVGKVGVPDYILRKPGKLSDTEFEAIKQHPQMGAVMVAAVPGLEATLDAVRHHHERWDGLGYPYGLSGTATPIIARLMAVADAYSAMTTNRPYRKGMSPAKAQSILREGSGTQWDPACVTAFLYALKYDSIPVTISC